MIDCDPVAKDIIRALERVYSEQFQSEIQSATNPYGNGGAVQAITQKLLSIPYDRLLKKSFHDIVS